MTPPESSPSDGGSLRWTGVVVMKGHPNHPMVHHHGLGDLSVDGSRVELRSFGTEEVLAGAAASDVTVGSTKALEDFASILFVDFGEGSAPRHETQFAVDFAPAHARGDFVHPDGTVSHGALLEYQERLSVEDFEAGMRSRQEFTEAVTRLGGRREDDTTLFERLLAAWPY